MAKYNNRKTEVHGRIFDSQGEAECYLVLKAMEQKGEIKILGFQDKVYLTRAKILMKPDFAILNRTIPGWLGLPEWIEFKGKELSSYCIKRRLWKFYGPGPLRIFKKVQGRISEVERIVPKQIVEIPTKGKTK